jgi:hypothetical protein
VPLRRLAEAQELSLQRTPPHVFSIQLRVETDFELLGRCAVPVSPHTPIRLLSGSRCPQISRAVAQGVFRSRIGNPLLASLSMIVIRDIDGRYDRQSSESLNEWASELVVGIVSFLEFQEPIPVHTEDLLLSARPHMRRHYVRIAYLLRVHKILKEVGKVVRTSMSRADLVWSLCHGFVSQSITLRRPGYKTRAQLEIVLVPRVRPCRD